MLNNIEMQGTVLAGLKCAISIANIGKEALQNCVKTRLISIESKSIQIVVVVVVVVFVPKKIVPKILAQKFWNKKSVAQKKGKKIF